jgi:hypothetical protein
MGPTENLKDTHVQCGAASGVRPGVWAVLQHALRWIDLLVADLKGRGAALRSGTFNHARHVIQHISHPRFVR